MFVFSVWQFFPFQSGTFLVNTKVRLACSRVTEIRDKSPSWTILFTLSFIIQGKICHVWTNLEYQEISILIRKLFLTFRSTASIILNK